VVEGIARGGRQEPAILQPLGGEPVWSPWQAAPSGWPLAGGATAARREASEGRFPCHEFDLQERPKNVPTDGAVPDSPSGASILSVSLSENCDQPESGVFSAVRRPLSNPKSERRTRGEVKSAAIGRLNGDDESHALRSGEISTR